jgi:hypothetical protein
MRVANAPTARGVALLAGLIVLAVLANPAHGFRSNSFYSPSGNIECRALADYLNRPVMACTTFNNGRVAYIYRYSHTYLAVVNGQFGFRRGLGPTLAYNHTWNGYGFECDSLVSGMQCQNVAGHGFKIAREGVIRF